MILADIENLFFTSPGTWESYTAFVFEDENSADSWMEDKLDGGENHDSEVFVTIHSDRRVTSYIKEEICNRKVDMIFAIAKDTFVVVLGDEE